jgi:hypothetical protein
MDPRFNNTLLLQQDQETIVVDILSNPRSRNAIGGINYLKRTLYLVRRHFQLREAYAMHSNLTNTFLGT